MEATEEEIQPHKNTEGEATVVEDTEATQETELTSAEIADLKKKADASSQNFERLKKAEEELKKLKSAPKPEVLLQDGISNMDVLAIARANVHDDDVDTVLEFSKFKKIPVADALKDPLLNNMLNGKAEERKTASATIVRGGPRGASKASGEDLLRKAELTGEVPDSVEGMQAIFEARQARKLPRRS